MTGTTAHDVTRELDFRATDGLEVALLWRPRDDRVSVTVRDAKTGDFFELAVADKRDALAAFRHPYAFAAQHGVTYAVRPRERGVAATA
jgi:hypothetical protein